MDKLELEASVELANLLLNNREIVLSRYSWPGDEYGSGLSTLAYLNKGEATPIDLPYYTGHFFDFLWQGAGYIDVYYLQFIFGKENLTVDVEFDDSYRIWCGEDVEAKKITESGYQFLQRLVDNPQGTIPEEDFKGLKISLSLASDRCEKQIAQIRAMRDSSCEKIKEEFFSKYRKVNE